MVPDPIVQEVREAGEQLAAEAGGNLRRFFANLKQSQQRYRSRLATGTGKVSNSPQPDPKRGNALEIRVNEG